MTCQCPHCCQSVKFDLDSCGWTITCSLCDGQIQLPEAWQVEAAEDGGWRCNLGGRRGFESWDEDGEPIAGRSFWKTPALWTRWARQCTVCSWIFTFLALSFLVCASVCPVGGASGKSVPWSQSVSSFELFGFSSLELFGWSVLTASQLASEAWSECKRWEVLAGVVVTLIFLAGWVLFLIMR